MSVNPACRSRQTPALSLWRRASLLACTGMAAAVLSACSSAPQAEWQVNAVTAMDSAQRTYLNAENAAAAAELRKARLQTSRAADADALAQIELRQCAMQVASLDWQPCTAFDALRSAASPTQQHYADYLYAQVAPANIAFLPAAQQGIARAGTAAQAQAALQQIQEPLSKLVAAAVTLRRAGEPNQALLEAAIDAASAQGWRRPLLAWLQLQHQWAQQQQLPALVDASALRISLIEHGGQAAPTGQPPAQKQP